jgi:hypothetical protein
MTANVYVGTLPAYTLTVLPTGSGSGTVTSSPAGISCGSSCSASFPVCTPITLTPVSGSGATFSGWSGGGCSGTGTCKPALTADQTVTATFTTAETFTAATPPPGWTVVNNGGSSAVWSFANPGKRLNNTGGSGNFAIIDSGYFGAVAVNSELRSPVYNMSGKNIVTLSFKTDFNYRSNSYNEIADLDVSINGASGPWTNVWRKTASYRGPKTETVDITALAAGQSQLMVRFHYYNANNDRYWQVDDVAVWGLDTLPPDTTLSSGPANPTADSSAQFVFSSPDQSASFSCSLDNAAWSSCTSPKTYSGLVSGNHSFSVRAGDPSGNFDQSPATWNWGIPANLQLSVTGQNDRFYPTIAAALAAAPPSSTTTVRLLAMNFTENMELNNCGGEVTLAGGFNGDFSAVTGQTTITGQITVSCGLLLVDNLVIL